MPPPHEESEGSKFGVYFKIVESRNGWFRIVEPSRWDRAEDGGNRDLPVGWVHGRHVSFALQTDKAFERPDPKSPVVATTWRWEKGKNGANVGIGFRNPSECRGEWIKVLATGMSGKERPAWVRGICGVQETTCDGVVGDPIAYDKLPVSDKPPPGD